MAARPEELLEIDAHHANLYLVAIKQQRKSLVSHATNVVAGAREIAQFTMTAMKQSTKDSHLV